MALGEWLGLYPTAYFLLFLYERCVISRMPPRTIERVQKRCWLRDSCACVTRWCTSSTVDLASRVHHQRLRDLIPLHRSFRTDPTRPIRHEATFHLQRFQAHVEERNRCGARDSQMRLNESTIVASVPDSRLRRAEALLAIN